MSAQMTVKAKIRFDRRAKGRKVLARGKKAEPTAAAGRIPRVTRLLALAHRFEQLIEEGAVRDYAELARLGHVSRARVTQIMNLLSLAPAIQEEVLLCCAVADGRDPWTEHDLRQILRKLDWCTQNEAWGSLTAAIDSGTRS